MADVSTRIQAWCKSGEFPESDEFYALLTGPDAKFTSEEGPNWDFKDEWSHSLSNEYFGGIARLICAFSNGAGGLIIFGVHDSRRDGGHNKVHINFDRFRQALSQLLGLLPDIRLRSYKSEQFGDIDVLMVAARSQQLPPVRFASSCGKYAAGVLWIRAGHEVVAASPSHFPLLFCRIDARASAERLAALDGSIPPSPTSGKRFVGRVEVLDRLFAWLLNSDDPRTYVHGKGGSGKTTVAYEFARLVKDYGSELRIDGNDNPEAVVFLTAKEKALNVLTSEIEQQEPDFSCELGLYQKLLLYGGWSTDRSWLASLSIEDARREVAKYLDTVSALIVIDDVDTLTTKGIDPGSDWFYRSLCRATRRSKVLYTIRNAPTQSLSSSIEVPGLLGDDYEDFVEECSKQFKVPAPTKEFRQGDLVRLSERRPLVIESVLALRRTAGSYPRAAQVFEQHAGDVRDYVFGREWNALAGDPLPRLLLAALSDLNRGASFAELETILQVDASRVKDAIGAVREMFLQVDDAGGETAYSVAPLTRQFVSTQKPTLTGYPTVRERVRKFRRTLHIASPQVTELVMNVERLVPPQRIDHAEENVRLAWGLLAGRVHPPVVTEDPVFKSVLGYVAALQRPPNLTEAREAFEYALKMRWEPDVRYLRAWFDAERLSGVRDQWPLRVSDIVINGNRYTENDKISMISKKGSTLYAMGREFIFTDAVEAQKYLQEAINLHLRAFRLNCVNGDYRADISEEYARNTCFYLFGVVRRGDTPWEVADHVRSIASTRDVFLDPIYDPFLETLQYWRRTAVLPRQTGRIRASLRGLAELISARELWLEGERMRKLAEALRETDQGLSKRERDRTPSTATPGER